MSISVANNASSQVPVIVFAYTSPGVVSVQPKSAMYIVPNPSASTVFRVSLFLSVPASASGQSAVISAYGVDANGIEIQISSSAVTPGMATQIVGVLTSIPGGTIKLSILPNGSDTFVSVHTYSMVIENL